MLVAQVEDLKEYISTLHLSFRSSSQRLASQVKTLERTLASERTISARLRVELQQLQAHPTEVLREVVKEVPVIREVAASSHGSVAKGGEDDKIPESKLQLVAMLSSERALSNKLEKERDEALRRLRQVMRGGNPTLHERKGSE